MRLAIASAILFCLSCSRDGSRTAGRAVRVGLVTDVAGRGDGSFNDAALRGLEDWAAGKRWTGSGYRDLPADAGRTSNRRPLGIQPIVLLSRAQEDYEPNLQLVVDQGAILTIGNGFMLENALEAVARKNPRAQLMLVDSPLFDAQGKRLLLPNVRTVTFREEEGSFLAGVLAARLSRTGKVGFVGGMALPLIERFEAGFRAGITSGATQKHPVVAEVAYTGGFDNVSRGKQLATHLLNGGADILFHAAGGDGLGVIQAVREAHQSGRRVFVIGCDSDQRAIAPEVVLTSMLKRVDVAVYETTQEAALGRFESGERSLGLREDGVSLAPIEINVEGREAALAAVAQFADRIQRGEIQVPSSRAALATFDRPRQP